MVGGVEEHEDEALVGSTLRLEAPEALGLGACTRDGEGTPDGTCIMLKWQGYSWKALQCLQKEGVNITLVLLN